jgi:hypothetical protein
MTRSHKLSLFRAGLVLLAATAGAPQPSHAGPAAGAAAGALAGQSFVVSVAAPAAKVGAPSATTVTFKAAAGYHINLDFPTTLKLNLPAGVSTPKADLKKADAKVSKEEGSFQFPLTAASAGQKAIQGELRFAVCTETTSEPQRTAVTITLDVKP